MLERAQPALTISLHIIGKDRLGEERHMTKNIVKDVWLFKVIHLVTPANETPCWETLIGEMGKKHIIGHKMRDHDNLPSRQRF